MKNKSVQKIADAKAARLAATTTSREADSATNCAKLAKVVLKKARKAYKQARKAAKRTAKRAKKAQREFAALAKYLKRPKKAAGKPKTKHPVLKTRPAAKKKNTVIARKPMRAAAPRPSPIKLPDDSGLATPQVA